MKCEIRLGSRRTEEWTLTSFYCPHCASKTVWEAEGGDYPVGPELFCSTCGGSFYSPEAPSLDELEVKERMERARAIREADHTPQPSDAISPLPSS
jgi:rRNA maturation protein Nop10